MTGRSATPAAPLATGVAAGVLLGVTFGVPWIIGSILIVAAIWLKGRVRTGVFAAGVGIIAGVMASPVPLPSDIDGHECEVTGRIEKVDRTPETTRLVVGVSAIKPADSVEAQESNVRTLVTFHGFNDALRPGIEVKVKGKIASPDSVVDVPYGVDYNRYLFIDGVTSRMNVYDYDDLRIVDDNPGRWYGWTYNLRENWLEAIASAGFDEQTTAFLLAVLGGDGLLMTEDMEEELRSTGLAHLLAISGMHLAIVVLVMTCMLYGLRMTGVTRWLYFVLTATGTCVYAVAAGGSPSVCRAAVMMLVLLGDQVFEVRSNAYQALAVSVTVWLLINPLWLYSPGFQLSVVAVLGVVTFGRRLDLVPRRYRFVRFVVNMAVLPVIAIVSTMTLTLFYFHALPLGFWLPNIVASMLVPLVICFGFVASLLTLAGVPCGMFRTLTDFTYGWLQTVVDGMAGWFADGYKPIFLSDVSLALLGLLVVAAGVAVWRPTRRNMVITAVASAAVVVSCVFLSPKLPEAEVYIPRHTGSTDIIVSDGGRVYVWSPPDSVLRIDPRPRLLTAYREFYRSRGVEEPTPLPDPFRGRHVTREGGMLTVGKTRLAIIESDVPAEQGRADYAVVTDRFRGDVVGMARQLDVDSVFIAREVNSRRADRFERELTDAGIPFRRMKERGWATIIN